MFETDVQTRSQYLKQINGVGEEGLVQAPPNMDKEEVSKIVN
jgi:hypothetical protein